jgi:hypothetical protein
MVCQLGSLVVGGFDGFYRYSTWMKLSGTCEPPRAVARQASLSVALLEAKTFVYCRRRVC